MVERQLMRLYVAGSVIVCIAGLAYVYVQPPQSTRVTRGGVPHFTPPITHPETGESLPVERLVQHYRGERP